VTGVAPFARSLDQELLALLRGASLECLVCGEFVMHARESVVFCPECGTQIGNEQAFAAVELGLQAG
jgi:Zn finger protein HypA/HybF involved in hydrogenase expression